MWERGDSSTTTHRLRETALPRQYLSSQGCYVLFRDQLLRLWV